ncbi:unnamed protein product [Rotaria sp. Silwood1]|nr:unnamed protein product [Rotaria sp. Silwood1]CAF0857973.1 unnamed protein product [Rotaria sp. Silwood1]CAF3354826.1 unnamed protein product [Rotaria sp. Silwood1]CAF3386701.1 unnamed protein product [Rotaria sp. Silwood1]CAF4483775.1 unnamed protein product [Rotaria sp. Silwood1]
MDQYNMSLTSTFSTLLLLLTNQSFNRTLSSSLSSISKNNVMRYSQVVYVAALVILGVSGNIICAIVFCTKSLRRIRSSPYLFILAIIDAFFILDLLPGMLHTAFFSDLYRKIRCICYVQTYISFVASFVHIWMVLVFTAERFFAVNFPLKHMSQCTPNLSRIVILIIIIPPFICYIHPAFFVSEVDNKGQCREKDGYERYLNNLNIIDTIMTMFLPFILVLILNILIIRKLFCSKAFREHAFANGSRYQCQRASNGKKKINSTSIKQISTSLTPIIGLSQSNSILSHRSQRIIRPFRSTRKREPLCLYRTFTNAESSQVNINNNDTNNNPLIEQQESMRLKSTFTKHQIPLSKRHESAQRHVLTELRLTKMLLAISLTCLSLNFPSYYLRFLFLYERSEENSASNKTTTTTHESDFPFYRNVIFLCMSYLSYSINIFIYLLFGGNFRRALKRLFSFTPSRAENFNTTLRRKAFFNNEKQYGNMTDYDSIAMTSTSLNDSLRGSSKSFKLRDQSSLYRPSQKQPIFTS